MTIQKRGMRTSISLEHLIRPRIPVRKESIPLTAEDHEAHRRAEIALEELNNNPWIDWGYEGEPELRPLEPRVRYIYKEDE